MLKKVKRNYHPDALWWLERDKGVDLQATVRAKKEMADREKAERVNFFDLKFDSVQKKLNNFSYYSRRFGE